MVSRSELINRMLSEQIDDPPYFKNNRMWTSLTDFVKDNLSEVDEKIQVIDNCIWGKLVVMEKNTRIAKAYLRSGAVAIDGSTFEFDGSRLGLGAFSYLAANRTSHNLLSKIGKGIDLYVDFLGNVCLSNRTGRKIYVEAQETKYDIGIYKEKIFDLRKFKQSISKCNVNDKEIQKIKEGAIIWIQFAKGNSPLDSPLWLCLIHVIAIEMIAMLSPHPSSSSVTSSASSASPKEHPSPPRWTAPRRKRSENFYEQCTRDDNNSVRDREEALYSMPEAIAPPPPISKRTVSKEKVPSLRSRSSTCNTPSTEATRLSRFTQHENEQKHEKHREAQKRGGVRKRLEKSLGPPIIDKSGSMSNLGNMSSSIIDLRTLANMRRPVYFQKPVTNRSGKHIFL